MLQAIIFRIFPTALEISMVCGILVSQEPIQFHFLLTIEIDLEIWLGFRCNHCHYFSCIHLVHRSHNLMEVSIIIYLTQPIDSISLELNFAAMQIRRTIKLRP